MRELLRALTPTGWIVAALVTAFLGLFAAYKIADWRADRAERKAAEAVQREVVSKLETEGERQSAARTHQTHTIIIQAERAAHEAVRDAYQAEDAHVPLDAARADRLRAHDARLCAINRLDGCPAADDAGTGR